jgi:16S rRNA processing protein RimM
VSQATPAWTGTGAEPDWPGDAVEVARIAGAWGVKGWIKVQPFATDPQALYSSRRWFLRPPEGAVPGPAPAAPPPLLRVIQARAHGEFVVAQVHDVGDRSAAEALRGARVFVGRASFPTAGSDEYYWVDLIGLTVVDRAGQTLGRVVGLLDTGPHSVLRVAPEGGPQGAAAEEAERLIPFVAAYVDDVDLAARRLTVDWASDY